MKMIFQAKWMLIFVFWITTLLSSFSSFAQYSIIGNFPPLAGQEVKLIGFQNVGIYTIDSVKVSEQGIFTLKYTDKDWGMGYLSAADNKAYFVVLAKENIQLKGDVFNPPDRVHVLSGKESQWFVQYANEHSKREQALSAWVYLNKIYDQDSLFSKHKKTQQSIASEMQRIEQEDIDFVNNLDVQSYVRWYLPLRKLVSSVSTVAQFRTEEIPTTINAFRNLDYTDARLYKSGLLKDVIESHFWLMENMGQPLDTVFKEMSISIDFMLANLSNSEDKFNIITKYLFNLLEKHSLFQASEYLSIKVLTQNSCVVNDDLAKKLESYRAMKKGNVAPDIVFTGDVFKSAMELKKTKKLSDIQSAYKVVLFGASWCPQCVEELSQLRFLYPKWKSKGVEVLFVSLDSDKAIFEKFSKAFPFISMCDYKQWDMKAAQDYYIFATPSMFLLDNNQKIVLRPNSVKQMDAWVDFYLGENKE